MADQPKTQSYKGTEPVHRPEGVNNSERYLAKLCDHTFLSLWSYPSLTRDQGRKKEKDGKRKGDGKELCDLLVVFGNDILIFQDKACVFKDSGDLQLDWNRWYRDAIKEGAKPIWGAERWIKENPGLIFLDRLCTQPFPFVFPDVKVAHYHRIIVAHGASERCKQELGGSGSLMIMANAIGPQALGVEVGEQSFTTGQIDPSKGFVHIFDDITLDIALGTLDTISDFVAYLNKKEAFISSGRLLSAAGEEELIAAYLTHVNDDGEHDFIFPAKESGIVLDEGSWAKFCQSPQRIAQLKANKYSYAWDILIEEFNKHGLAGTHHFTTHTIDAAEVAHRFLAGENRTSRRFLATSFFSLLSETDSNDMGVLVAKSPCQNDLYFVLMVFPHRDYSEENYRAMRLDFLMKCCFVSKLKFPDAKHIVGMVTDSGLAKYSSEALTYLNATEWSEDMEREAERIKEEYNLMTSGCTIQGKIKEYPDVNMRPQWGKHKKIQSSTSYQSPARVGRNEMCPCGSGNKFKRCHGK